MKATSQRALLDRAEDWVDTQPNMRIADAHSASDQAWIHSYQKGPPFLLPGEPPRQYVLAWVLLPDEVVDP